MVHNLSQSCSRNLTARSARDIVQLAAFTITADEKRVCSCARQATAASAPGRAGIRDFRRSQLVEASCRRSSSHSASRRSR